MDIYKTILLDIIEPISQQSPTELANVVDSLDEFDVAGMAIAKTIKRIMRFIGLTMSLSDELDDVVENSGEGTNKYSFWMIE